MLSNLVFSAAGCAADVWCATEQIDEDGWVLEATGAEVVEKGEWYYKADLSVVHRDYNTTAQDIIVQVHTLSNQILEKMKHRDAFDQRDSCRILNLMTSELAGQTPWGFLHSVWFVLQSFCMVDIFVDSAQELEALAKLVPANKRKLGDDGDEGPAPKKNPWRKCAKCGK